MNKITKILSILLFSGLFLQRPAQALIVSVTIMKNPETGQVVYLLGDMHTLGESNAEAARYKKEEKILNKLFALLQQNKQKQTTVLLELPENEKDRNFLRKSYETIQKINRLNLKLPDTSWSNQIVSTLSMTAESKTYNNFQNFYTKLTSQSPANVSVKCVDLRGSSITLQEVADLELRSQLYDFKHEVTTNKTLQDAYDDCKKIFQLAEELQLKPIFNLTPLFPIMPIFEYHKLSPENYSPPENLEVEFDKPVQKILHESIKSSLAKPDKSDADFSNYPYNLYIAKLLYLANNGDTTFLTAGVDIPAVHEITKSSATNKVLVLTGVAHTINITSYLESLGYASLYKSVVKIKDDDGKMTTTTYEELDFKLKIMQIPEEAIKLSKQILPLAPQDLELIDDEKLEEFLATKQVVSEIVETVAAEEGLS